MSQLVKNLPAVQETGLNPWVRKIPWRREWQPTPAFLPGEFIDRIHRQKSLAGYSPWGHKESDTHTHTKRRGSVAGCCSILIKKLMAVLALCLCAQPFSSCGKGAALCCGAGSLIAVASLVVEHPL